jgi:hypothetical protein
MQAIQDGIEDGFKPSFRVTRDVLVAFNFVASDGGTIALDKGTIAPDRGVFASDSRAVVSGSRPDGGAGRQRGWNWLAK